MLKKKKKKKKKKTNHSYMTILNGSNDINDPSNISRYNIKSVKDMLQSMEVKNSYSIRLFYVQKHWDFTAIDLFKIAVFL